MSGAQKRPDEAASGIPTLVEAQLALGQMALDRGDGEAARDWFRIVARAGDGRGYNMLGRCFERGWGGAPDPAAAARYYRQAAELGDAWALFNLGDLHFAGRGVEQDDAAAYALYLAAARRGIAKALNMLGLFHEEGRAVESNSNHARAFFEAAANGGDCWGGFNHARLLMQEGRLAEAVVAFERALAHGFQDFYLAVAQALENHPDSRLDSLARKAAALARGESDLVARKA